MALSMFFFASSRCSAGEPVSTLAAEDKPRVKSDGLVVILKAMELF